MSLEDGMQFLSDHHGIDLLKNLSEQYTAGLFCDVQLKLSDCHVIKAHRNILSASSPYFYAMFTGGLKEASSDFVNLQHIASESIIEKLINFIYTGIFPTDFLLLL